MYHWVTSKSMHVSVLKTDFRVRIDSVLDFASLRTPVSPFNFSLESSFFRSLYKTYSKVIIILNCTFLVFICLSITILDTNLGLIQYLVLLQFNFKVTSSFLTILLQKGTYPAQPRNWCTSVNPIFANSCVQEMSQ